MILVCGEGLGVVWREWTFRTTTKRKWN